MLVKAAHPNALLLLLTPDVLLLLAAARVQAAERAARAAADRRHRMVADTSDDEAYLPSGRQPRAAARLRRLPGAALCLALRTASAWKLVPLLAWS